MPEFTARDLIETAIEIEKRGIMFYDVMAMSTDDPRARAVFEGLAAMERVHQATFESMLADRDIDAEAPFKNRDYIQALIDDAVFTDDFITSEMAEQADTDVKALELAISAEKDSILFYYELRDVLPDGPASLVDDILAEEKRHLEQLTAIKKNMG